MSTFTPLISYAAGVCGSFLPQPLKASRPATRTPNMMCSAFITVLSIGERRPKSVSARDRFLQIQNVRRFLLLCIDVYLYFTHEHTSFTSEPHRADPSDPTHGTWFPFHYSPRA